MHDADHAIVERVASQLQWVRGRRVLMDADLAVMYGVTTGALLQAVRRNAPRFPDDFVFELTREELQLLRSQTVISNSEQSEGRVQATQQLLGARIDDLEQRVIATDARRDIEIAQIIEAIRQLVNPPLPQRRPLGFQLPDDPTDG